MTIDLNCPFCDYEAECHPKDVRACSNLNCRMHNVFLPASVWNHRPTPDTGIGQAVELLTRIGQKMVRVIYQGEKFTEADCEEIRCTLNPSRLAPCHKEPS